MTTKKMMICSKYKTCFGRGGCYFADPHKFNRDCKTFFGDCPTCVPYPIKKPHEDSTSGYAVIELKPIPNHRGCPVCGKQPRWNANKEKPRLGGWLECFIFNHSVIVYAKTKAAAWKLWDERNG